jgi:hypothetical protein
VRREAEDELDVALRPVVEVLCEREVPIAAQADLAEARVEHDIHSRVEVVEAAIVRRAVAGPVARVENLSSVREAHKERGVSPDALVAHVHALLALAVGLGDRAVDIDDRALKNSAPFLRHTFVRATLMASDRSSSVRPPATTL